MPVAEGEVFAGYRVIRLLGSGGMGEVYLAQHPRLPRLEALKVLPTAVSADGEYRQRFAREADIAASLWHSHIVAVHDRGEQDGQLWIAMDYVDGTDAAKLLRDRYPHGMPPKDVGDIVSAIAGALDYAHERYLLHRDVKPSNILMADPRSSDRRILLADFGIARGVHDTGGLTATNMTVGSVDYAAPEQLTGGAVDGRSDQYALACTAFHLLTGAPPFVHSNPAVVIGSHLSAAPPSLTTTRPELAEMERVLAKAMSKDPAQRFGSCSEFAMALAHSSVGTAGPTSATQLATPVSGSSPGGQQRRAASPHQRPSRRPVLFAGAVALLAAVGLVAFVGARLGGTSSSTSPSASTPPAAEAAPANETGAETVTMTAPAVTVTRPVQPPVGGAPPRPRSSSVPAGDLGLGTPMTAPRCNGQGIVILGSVTTPGEYEQGVRRLLDANPGAGYLRTDMSCPSLRQATDAGNPIYAVYAFGGTTQGEVCSRVRAVGGIAYGKWLDMTTDPAYIIPC